MKDETLLLLRSLKQTIDEIAPFLDKAQTEVYGKIQESSMDLVMGELTMVVVMLTNADSNLDSNELKIINDMRHVVYGYGIQELDSNNCVESHKLISPIHLQSLMGASL